MTSFPKHRQKKQNIVRGDIDQRNFCFNSRGLYTGKGQKHLLEC